MSPTAVQARAMYRAILRELPSRSITSPTPLKLHIRGTFANPPTSRSKSHKDLLVEVDQFIQYVKAQRVYATLLERYNPGMGMDEEERVNLTMRRVGLGAPDEYIKDK